VLEDALSRMKLQHDYANLEAPVRIRGATGTIKDFFESFPEAFVPLNGHLTILEAVVAPKSHDLILGQLWLHDTNP